MRIILGLLFATDTHSTGDRSSTTMRIILGLLFATGLGAVLGVDLNDPVPCNKTAMLEANGIIQLVNNGTSDSPCTWNLTHPEQKQFYFLQISTEGLKPNDSVTVYDGPENLVTMKSQPAPVLVLSFDTITTLQMLQQSGKVTITVLYSSDDCTVKMEGKTSGEIRSPLYLPGASRSFNCSFKVNTSSSITSFPAPQILDLSFVSFTLSSGQLEVSTGVNSTVVNGTAIPTDLFSTNDLAMNLTMTVTNSSAMQSFDAIFAPVDEACSKVYSVNGSRKVAVTVEVMHAYLRDCRAVIQSSNKRRLALHLDTVFLNGGLDRLIVRDQGSQSGTILGQVSAEDIQPGTVFLSKSTAMWMRVVMDQGIADQPYTMSFTVVEVENGGRFDNEGQITLETPITANSSNVSFQLYAADNQIQLVFGKAQMYGSAVLDVYEGLQENDDNRIVSFLSNTAFFPVVSKLNSMLVVARNFYNTQNFTANFSTFMSDGCYRISHTDTEELTTTYSTSSTKCRWIISPTTTGYVMLTVGMLSLQTNTTLTVLQGTEEFPTTLAVWDPSNSQSTFPSIVVPTNKRVEVVYQSHNNCTANCTGSAVSMQYSVVPSYCGIQKSGGAGTVTSPSFPNTYPLNSDCQWGLNTTPKQALVYLSFDSFSLALLHSFSVSQTKNSTSSPVAVFSGSTRPADLVVKADIVTLNFSSQTPGGVAQAVASGFSLQYRMLECGGNVTDLKGNLTSSARSECIWVVSLPAQDKNKSVNIVQFSVKLSGKPGSNDLGLDIRDGPSAWDAPLGGNWSVGQSRPILSRYNAIFVRFLPQSGSNLSLALNYSTYKCNSSQLCNNGVCLHPDWRCNGVDDCGDDTDERNCTAPGPTPTPSPFPQSHDGYVASFWMAVVAILALAMGVVLAFLIPAIYRRLKYPNYSALRDLTAPVDA